MDQNKNDNGIIKNIKLIFLALKYLVFLFEGRNQEQNKLIN
jgi:hypothetical protein